MSKMIHRYIGIMSVALSALVSVACAQSDEVMKDTGDIVRVMRHPDGTRSIYQRQQGWRGMRCSTYTASGRLAAVSDYTEGEYGQLVGCIIYDHTKRNIIYKVAYGYDSRARLVEERMYSHPQGKLVQRVMYKYDASGNRSKPLIVSLNTSGPSTEIAPTMQYDANAINRDMKKKRRRR